VGEVGTDESVQIISRFRAVLSTFGTVLLNFLS
jgi:hypothetical protein